jgi:hypothetical protein
MLFFFRNGTAASSCKFFFLLLSRGIHFTREFDATSGVLWEPVGIRKPDLS